MAGDAAWNRSWCGAEDLCGNVWEWTSSRWGRNWQTLDYRYPYHAGDGREDPTGSHARVIRGGSWFDLLREAHPANRGRYLPGSRGSNIGFRLARGHNPAFVLDTMGSQPDHSTVRLFFSSFCLLCQ